MQAAAYWSIEGPCALIGASRCPHLPPPYISHSHDRGLGTALTVSDCNELFNMRLWALPSADVSAPHMCSSLHNWGSTLSAAPVV